MLEWERSALTATYNIYLCTSWNKVPLGSKENCSLTQCFQQALGQIWTQSCLCLRLMVNGSTGPLWSTRSCRLTWTIHLTATALDHRGIRETLVAEVNRMGTFWSMVGAGTYHCELTWHQKELMALNLGPMTVYNSLQEKLYLPTIRKNLRE